jgi:hypothetical protein
LPDIENLVQPSRRQVHISPRAAEPGSWIGAASRTLEPGSAESRTNDAGAHAAEPGFNWGGGARWQDAMAELLVERVPDAGPPPLPQVFRLD